MERYEEALSPIEMAIVSGMGADAHQLYFEAVLKSKGKEYFNGKDLRLDQRRDQPNYEVNGVDLSNIKISFNHTSNTTFSDVNFSGSDLSDSEFESVIFKGVNFSGANLNDVEFKNTKYDQKTIWPEGFDSNRDGLEVIREIEK